MGRKKSVTIGRTASFLQDNRVITGTITEVTVDILTTEGFTYSVNLEELYNSSKTAKVDLRKEIGKKIRELQIEVSSLEKLSNTI